ncbi:hypothetical protein LSCM1_04417 [Leishmania martiniquensis]|uniref:Uncharacterized protein n=1 Tax=Leishmania martiniquensis TaxID=1580590 RepID=A0A836G2G3_9TRYP|nr:hypothetical protein LSCM1_04417 [Leishmania martiniquensis]
MPADCHPERFERVTVYVDIAAASVVPGEGEEAAVLLELIQTSAAALTRNLVIVDSQQLFASAEPRGQSPPPKQGAGAVSAAASRNTSCTVQLLRYWQEEEADVYTRDVNNTVPFMRDWECLVTCKDTRDGAVAYALHRRQMPVLSLAPTQASTPTQAPKTAVEELLYACVPCGATLEDKKDAITHFFTFPLESGAYVVASSVPAAGTSKPQHSCETDPATASAATVVVNRDGYPVRLPWTSSLLPPPPARFAGVLQELCFADSPQMKVLRQRNPLLPGALAAFHRYGNRGLLRSVLQRGYRVEMVETAEGEKATASADDWVRQFADLSTTNSNGADSHRRQTTAVATLKEFEMKWLDLPLPQLQS